MAEGFAKHLGQETVQAASCGLRFSGVLDRIAVSVMEERGIQIGHYLSKGVEGIECDSFDKIVLMDGCRLPVLDPAKIEQWNIEDPRKKMIEGYRRVRDTIEQKVKDLIGHARHS